MSPRRGDQSFDLATGEAWRYEDEELGWVPIQSPAPASATLYPQAELGEPIVVPVGPDGRVTLPVAGLWSIGPDRAILLERDE